MLPLSPAASPVSAATRLRSIFSGSVGNLVEWYDWYVAGCAALSLLVYLRMRDTRLTSRLDDEAR